MQLDAYTPAALAIIFGLGFCVLFTVLATALGPRRMSAAKAAPFECGSEPIGSPRGRHSVRFYQVAILFLVFDIEAAFMFPWALMYRELSKAPPSAQFPEGGISFFGFAEMLVFVAVLGVALAFVWRKKAIGWD